MRRGQITLALSLFVRRNLSGRPGTGLFHRGIHLCFGRWRWWLRMSLRADADDLTFHKLIALGMGPDAIHQRPAGL